MAKRSAARPPRVLFGIGGLNAGGSETQIVEILTRLHPQRLNVTLVLAREPEPGPRLDRLREAGVRIRSVLEPAMDRLPGPRPLAQLLRFTLIARKYHRLVREEAPDVVYPWLEETSLFLVPAALRERVPAVVARRSVSGAQVENIPIARVGIRRAEAMAHAVTANSEAVLRQAIERGISPDRLRLVRNAHASLPPLPFPGRDTVVLGYLANFRREKGHARLIRCLLALRAKTPWTMLLAGEGRLPPALEGEIQQRGLVDRVKLVGVARDGREFWSRCDGAVLLSDHEGSPNALIEAAFAGRPIVATSVGGTPEAVAPDGGTLVHVDDVDGTADALRRLIEDPGLRARQGQRGHAFVSDRFDAEKSARGHLAAIYAALLQGG